MPFQGCAEAFCWVSMPKCSYHQVNGVLFLVLLTRGTQDIKMVVEEAGQLNRPQCSTEVYFEVLEGWKEKSTPAEYELRCTQYTTRSWGCGSHWRSTQSLKSVRSLSTLCQYEKWIQAYNDNLVATSCIFSCQFWNTSTNSN